MKLLLGRVQFLVKVICSISLALMSAIVLMQVINRNVFGGSFKWVEELSTMCMVCITFLGAALANAMNAHTRIELFVNLLPHRASQLVFAAGEGLCAVFSVALAVYCWPLITGNLHTMSPAMKLPLCINYIVFFAAMLLSAVYLLLRAASRVTGNFDDSPKAETSESK
ncbi:MAG: TRAP transporter small permease [Succinivibrio sp.]|jgi:TRAP-type C4-dicarboxylate transport system permease small subunit|nr:TRAP transporter small permease [Succinivibrio sp.]